MGIPDHAFLDWTRGKTSEHITDRDVELAGDVSTTQLILYSLARLGAGTRFVEIGVADGSTTLPLLKAAEDNGGHLVSVDPSGCEDAKRLVDAYGYEAFWTFHECTTEAAIQRPEFRDFVQDPDGLDLVYIDGCHSAQGVAFDLCTLFPHVRSGGFVVMHDWCSFDHEALEHPWERDELFVDRGTLSQQRSTYSMDCSCGVARALFHLTHTEGSPLYKQKVHVLPLHPNLQKRSRGIKCTSPDYPILVLEKEYDTPAGCFDGKFCAESFLRSWK